MCVCVPVLRWYNIICVFVLLLYPLSNTHIFRLFTWMKKKLGKTRDKFSWYVYSKFLNILHMMGFHCLMFMCLCSMFTLSCHSWISEKRRLKWATLCWVCNTFNSIIWRITWTSNTCIHWCLRECMLGCGDFVTNMGPWIFWLLLPKEQ